MGLVKIGMEAFTQFRDYCYMAMFGHLSLSEESGSLDLESVKGEFDEEQCEIARDMYEQTLIRYRGIQDKAAVLQQNVTVLFPFSLALVAYWEGGGGSPVLVVFALYGVCSSFLAFLAAFRARQVQALQQPGVEVVIEMSALKVAEEGVLAGRIDKRARLYLMCAVDNMDVCDKVGTLVLASEYFIRMTMLFLFCAAIVVVHALP